MLDVAAYIYFPIVTIWLVVFGVAIYFYRVNPILFGSSRLLLLVMLVDATRNMLENIYFGLYFGSRYGVFDAVFAETLGRPGLLVLPKIANIAAALLVLFILLLRWLPRAAQERSALRRQADIDAMTGLNNRRHFLAAAQAECDRATRYRRPLSMAMLDIDNFKSINDRYGHDVGDQCIAAVARTCREIARESDIAGRMGGEEFALLLPETELEAALAFGERLRSTIMAMKFPIQDLIVTVSVGISAWRESSTLDETIKQADLALYDAKRSGRNRVCQYMRP